MADNRIGNVHHRNRPFAKRGGWHAAIFIICVEFAEKLAYYSLSGNLITYLTKDLNESNATAAKNVNYWSGISSLTPLLGGFLADSYLGRFNAIILSTIIYLLGMIWLTVSTSVAKNNSTLFFVGLYILSIGEGGHRPCVLTFAANQFDDDSQEEKSTKSSFFNYWYLGLVVAAVAASIVIYLEEHSGWSLGIGIMSGVVAIALALFLLGIPKYKKDGPTGSPFTSMAQVFVATIRKWRLRSTRDSHVYWLGEDEINNGQLQRQNKINVLAHTDQLRFLDKAMIIDELDASNKTRNPWRLCSVTQVEEVKLVLRLVPIWLSCLMFYVVQAQLHTFNVKQGDTMVRTIGHIELPPASIQSITGFFIVGAVLIYDRVFVPLARKFTGHPYGITVLQRIGLGLFLSILNMVVGALIEIKRVGIARDNNLIDSPKLPMSIWWMMPQYLILGISDALAVVGMQQLFYDEVAETMRSLGAAAYTSLQGFGTLLSNVIIIFVQDISGRMNEKWLAGKNLNTAHLASFYWVLAGLCAVNLFIYVMVARKFVYKKVKVVDDLHINTDRNQV